MEEEVEEDDEVVDGETIFLAALNHSAFAKNGGSVILRLTSDSGAHTIRGFLLLLPLDDCAAKNRATSVGSELISSSGFAGVGAWEARVEEEGVGEGRTPDTDGGLTEIGGCEDEEEEEEEEEEEDVSLMPPTTLGFVAPVSLTRVTGPAPTLS